MRIYTFFSANTQSAAERMAFAGHRDSARHAYMPILSRVSSPTGTLRKHLRAPRPRRARRRTLIVIGAVLALAAVATTVVVVAQKTPREFTWPSTGVAALSVGDTVSTSPGADQQRPMASLAKLVTALVALDRVPLEAGSAGPVFPLTDDDAAIAAEEGSQGGQTTPAAAGDVTSMRQLLAETLVASSNNAARSLVRHVFGDDGAYVFAARRWLDAHGLPDVEIADATGLSPMTRGSARDLLAIARLADASPIIRELSASRTITLSDGREFPSTNELLGTLGVDGLKTGHTDAAGYTIAFSADRGARRVVGVLLGSSSEAQRGTDVTRLLAQVANG